jgi:hypothetical protein
MFKMVRDTHTRLLDRLEDAKRQRGADEFERIKEQSDAAAKKTRGGDA